MIFLDYAGNTKTDPKVIAINNEFTKNINKYNNPHTSINNTQDEINRTRSIILELCGYSSESHCCLFTSGSTNACKLLAETLNKSYTFNYLFDNHNSVLGIGTQFDINNRKIIESFDLDVLKSKGIFAYPAESNFNGQLYPLYLDKDDECYTILDASKYLTTHSMSNLKESNADFIFFTFYKITGLPQGLGVLLVKRSAIHILNKTYFGGGTLDNIIPSTLNYTSRSFDYFYEDGSLPYLNILIAQKAIQIIQPQIKKNERNIVELTNYAIISLKFLDYIVYSNPKNGSIITFNHKTIGHKTIESICKSNNIIIRTGCFCNAGGCAKALKLSDEDLNYFIQNGRKCSDNMDLIDNRHTGACRISIGLFTTKKEIDFILNILGDLTNSKIDNKKINNVKLIGMYIYPIKSCNGIKIDESYINSNGLLHDRMYAIRNKNKRLMTMKQFPQLTKLKLINKNNSFFIINKEKSKEINIEDENINKWLSENLEVECKLEKTKDDKNFSNTSQYLIINKNSMYDLNYRILLNYVHFKIIAYVISLFYWIINYDRFRPNLIIDAPAYLEDKIDNFTINNIEFNKDMLCVRCNATTVDNNTYSKDKSFEPMKTLIKYRNINGKVTFGVLYSATYDKVNNFISNNSILSILKK